jgi:putative ABC transport system substrate-binding protein
VRIVRALLPSLAAGLLSAPAAADHPDALIVEAVSARPYDLARDGVEQGLPRHVHVARVRLDLEEPQSEARRIESMRPRVLLTMGTQATAWALDYTRGIPVVFAMVLNPMQSGLVRSFSRPGSRITGASLDIQPDEHFRALRNLLGAREIGVLYDPEQTAMIIGEARRAAGRSGVRLRAVPLSGGRPVDDAFDRLGSVDALWSVPDRTVFASGAAQEVLLQTLRRGIPFMGLSEQYVRSGALLALAVSYEENGRQAAERVARILNGEDPGRIPIARPEQIEIVVNPNTESRLGLELPRNGSDRLRFLD